MSMQKQRSEKLHKVLSRCGYGSRRDIEGFIQSCRVSVDGKVATLGDRIEVKPHTKIRLDGYLLKIETKIIARILAYYKLEGELCTHRDPEGRCTVFDRLPRLMRSRWISIGRLDINTCGLLLFTTDGELANRLMHPDHEVEREYIVRVFGDINDAQMCQLTTSVQLEDGEAHFKALTYRGGKGINKWFNVTLIEGRHREVRRLWQAVGIQVNRLIRIRYGDFYLPRMLPRGGWIELGLEQVNYFYKLVGLPNAIANNVSSENTRRNITDKHLHFTTKQHT